MDFLKFIESARSCRRFDETRPLTYNDLEWLLECCRLAPSARNAQELRFITVNQPGICQNLVKISRWATAIKDWGGPKAGEQPTAFIATLMPEHGGNTLCFDAGIANQTIQLAASSRGWGACIILSFDHLKTAELLAPPEGLKIALIIALGIAAEKRVIEPMPENGSFNYWRDKDGIHHVPKRSIAELIVKKM